MKILGTHTPIRIQPPSKEGRLNRRDFLIRITAGIVSVPLITHCGRTGFVDLTKYNDFLLQNPAVRDAIIFREYDGYDTWSEEMRSQLLDYLQIFESNSSYPYNEPPTPGEGSSFDRTILSDQDAWNFYLASIAFSLYVEVNRLVPWSITNYTREELALLFTYQERPIELSPSERSDPLPTLPEDLFTFENNSAITAWNPRFVHQFLRDNAIIRSTPRDTIYAFTDLCRQGLSHAPWVGVLTTHYNYAGAPPIDRVLSRIAENTARVSGCHGATALYKSTFRTLNIPVKEDGRWAWVDSRSRSLYHSRIVLPTIDLAVPHTDNLYCTVPWRSLYRIPSNALFITISELNNYSFPLTYDEIFNNTYRHIFLLQTRYLDDGWLRMRCAELLGPPYFCEGQHTLEESFADQPFSTAEENTEAIRHLDQEIENLGGPRECIRILEEFHGRTLLHERC